MVSRIPTFSSKQIRFPSLGTIPTLAIGGFILAMMIHAPWITMTCMGLLYTALLPISYRLYKAREKRGYK
jgi:CDP-diacylglycerol--serine O-phosphatidyltransferase